MSVSRAIGLALPRISNPATQQPSKSTSQGQEIDKKTSRFKHEVLVCAFPYNT